MFNRRVLLLFIFLGFPLSYVSKSMENRGLILVGYFGEEIHIFEWIATGAFIVAAACLGLFVLSIFVLGVLPNMSGLGREEQEEDLIFTRNKLIEMDRDDEAHWNETHGQTASAQWMGGVDRPVYEDYRGILTDALTDEKIRDNHADRRRVRNGKVSDDFVSIGNGKYRRR